MTHRALLTMLALLAAPEALACGGFFCDQPAPRDTSLFDPEGPRVDQTSEKIVFAQDEGRIEVHVQVAFEGDVDDFAWIVPVPKVPELFVSSQTLFDQLETSTTPRFSLQRSTEGECRPVPPVDDEEDWDTDTDSWSQDVDDTDADTGGVTEPAVTVVDRQDVGPYETVTLQADDAEALVAWLTDEGFAIPADSTDAMRPYLADGAYFLALRMQKDREAGELVPLGMRYDGSTPQIPLTLTRIAAVPDMRLIVWVMGRGRAIPENYLHVEPNLTRLDWWSGGTRWRDLIREAADEAGGQAFATDFAGRLPNMVLWAEGWADMNALRRTADAFEWIVELRSRTVPSDPAVMNVLLRQIPVTDEHFAAHVQPLQVYNCPRCYEADLRNLPFDAEAATDDYRDSVVSPLRHADSLFSRDWTTTRLTSSMSPEEMTADPVFAWSDDLPRVRVQRSASEVTLCHPKLYWDQAPRELRIPGYPAVPLPSRAWTRDEGWEESDLTASLAGPPTHHIEQLRATSDAELILDNGDAIERAIEDYARQFRDDRGQRLVGNRVDGCGGCDGTGGAGGMAVLLSVGLLARRRLS